MAGMIEVSGVQHVAMTQAEWDRTHADFKGVITAQTREFRPWVFPELPVGTKTVLRWIDGSGTCLLPVQITD